MHSSGDHQLYNSIANTMIIDSLINGAAVANCIAGMTYPNGRDLTYDYGVADGMNDACSRIESVINAVIDSVNLATYQYLGTAGFVNAASAQPGINWTLIGTGNDPNTGDIYWGLDRFGRVDNCLRAQKRGRSSLFCFTL